MQPKITSAPWEVFPKPWVLQPCTCLPSPHWKLFRWSFQGQTGQRCFSVFLLPVARSQKLAQHQHKHSGVYTQVSDGSTTGEDSWHLKVLVHQKNLSVFGAEVTKHVWEKVILLSASQQRQARAEGCPDENLGRQDPRTPGCSSTCPSTSGAGGCCTLLQAGAVRVQLPEIWWSRALKWTSLAWSLKYKFQDSKFLGLDFSF